jgi:hypothetical protein
LDLWWEKWHWDRFLSKCFDFPLSLLFHQCPLFIFVLIQFFLKGQVGKAWEPPDKAYLGALERKYFYASLQGVNKNDDLFPVIQTFGTPAAYQMCSENSR